MTNDETVAANEFLAAHAAYEDARGALYEAQAKDKTPEQRVQAVAVFLTAAEQLDGARKAAEKALPKAEHLPEPHVPYNDVPMPPPLPEAIEPASEDPVTTPDLDPEQEQQ